MILVMLKVIYGQSYDTSMNNDDFDIGNALIQFYSA